VHALVNEHDVPAGSCNTTENTEIAVVTRVEKQTSLCLVEVRNLLLDGVREPRVTCE
jgi:hypothetical protein